jgi:integrase
MSNWTFRQKTRKKDGAEVWYCRSWQSVRGEDGVVRRVQIERSIQTVSKSEARERAREFTAEFVEALSRPVPEKKTAKQTLTFADAVGQYIETGGSKRYLEPIVRLIGLMPAADVDQPTCLDVVGRLYPNCTAATTNRQVWTPINAVLRFVDIRAPLKRPKGHDRLPTVDKAALPTDGWFDAVSEHLAPSKRALLLLISLHGLRISEAARRTPADVDPKRWTLTLPNTKDGSPYVIQLSRPVIDALMAYDWRGGKWLFGTSERGNIDRDLRKACAKAGVEPYGSHKIGRHSFAAKILEEGKSLPYLKQAGRWKSLKAVERYAHLAQSEVNDEVREFGAKWHAQRKAGEIIQISSKRKKI